jgi:trimeric autotransporter adhesin
MKTLRPWLGIVLTLLVSGCGDCGGGLWGGDAPDIESVDGGEADLPKDGGAADSDAGDEDTRTLVVSPQSIEAFEGDLAYFRAHLVDEDLTQDDVTGDVDWSLEGDPVGQMKAPGVVYTDAAGTAQVVAQMNGQRVEVSLTVIAPEADVIAIQVEPQGITVPEGFAVPVQLLAFYSDGQVREVSDIADWSSLAPSLVRVDFNDFGAPLLFGLAVGAGDVRATFGAFSADVAVTVEAASLEQIDIVPATAFVPAGSTNALEAIGRFSDGTYLNVTDGVVWESSNLQVATISNDSGAKGIVTGLAEGEVEISAISVGGEATGVAQLTVTPAEIISLDITPALIELAAGLSITVRASAVLTNQDAIDVTQEAIWAVAEPDMAFLSGGTGFLPLRLETVVPGETVLTATYAGVTAEAQVSISAAVLEAVELEPQDLVMSAGTDRQLIFTGTYSDGEHNNINANATWTTSDPEIAVVTESPPGRVSSQTPGTSTIMASFAGLSATTEVTVTDAVVVAVQVFPALVTAPAGDDVLFNAYAIYSDDTQRWITQESTWEVGDAAIASVSNALGEKGKAVGQVPGSTTVVVNFDGFSDAATLHVSDAEIDYAFAVPLYMGLHVGQKQMGRMLAAYTNGVTLEVGDQSTWISADPSIAQVSNAAGNRGQVTGLSAGETFIYGNFQGHETEIYVYVSDSEIVDILIWPPQTFLVPDLVTNVYLVASYEDDPEDYQNLTPEGIWSTDDENIATVGNFPFGAGLINAHSPGPVTVTARYGEYTVTQDYFVQDLDVESMELSPNSTILAVDGSQSFVAFAEFSNGSTHDVSSSSDFSSGDSATATFLENFRNVLIGLAPGDVEIRASFQGVDAVANVSVIQEEPDAVVISPVNPIINLYQPNQFYATGVFPGGETGDMTALCTWTSSDPGTLMIFDEWFAKGRAHGFEIGTAIVSIECGSLTDSTTVTITQ